VWKKGQQLENSAVVADVTKILCGKRANSLNTAHLLWMLQKYRKEKGPTAGNRIYFV
jgi:hypothetical protein